MTTPIRPSLAQLLGTPQTIAPRPQAVDAVTAQRNFFRQAMGEAMAAQAQTIAPATFKAADIALVTAAAQPTANSEQPILRPGSYLNIRV